MVLSHGPAIAGPRYYRLKPDKLESTRQCRHLTRRQGAARVPFFQCRIFGMRKDPQQSPAPVSTKPEIETFIEKVRALDPATATGHRGRLIFALDATMSQIGRASCRERV